MRYKRLLLLFVLLFMITGCQSKKAEYIIPVIVEGSIFSGESGSKVSLNLEYDDSWISKYDNHKYNSRLAVFSTLLCADSYFRTKDIERGNVNRVLIDENTEEYTQTALLEKLGFSDVKIIETYKAKEYTQDKNDSATITMAHKTVDNKYDSYVLVFRGCYSIGERLSIFDIGNSSDEYANLTGRHDEWTDKNVYKGLDVSCNRALEYIYEYINEYDNPEYANTILITGHSRGGMLANVVGARLEEDETLRTYTYTFNCSMTTTDSDAGRYSTIFNIFDSNDYYTDQIPLKDTQALRYGKDMSMDISANSKIKLDIAAIKGTDDYTCLSKDTKKEYDKLFNDCFDRESLYIINNFIKNFDSLDEASEYMNTMQEYIDAMSLTDLYKLSINTKTCTIDMCYCKASILLSYAQIQAYGKSAYDAALKLFEDDNTALDIAGIIYNNLSDLNGGHYIINDYVLSSYLK